jgi:23S rRNA (guanosine2251-2'-O)-methyltransferase
MRTREFDPRKPRPRPGQKFRQDSRQDSRQDGRQDSRRDGRPEGRGGDRKPPHRKPPRDDHDRPDTRPARHGRPETRGEDRKPPYQKRPRDDRDRPDTRPERHGRPERHRDERAGARPHGGDPWRRDDKRAQRDRQLKKKQWRPAPRDRDGPVILYGWHSVKAALENPARRFHKLMVTENAMQRLTDSGLTLPLAPTHVRQEEIEALVGPEAVHQGILAEADPLDAPAIEDLAPQRLVLVLDQITDPHNVGAIMRSAAAFAVEAVIVTQRHSPEATGVLAKAASAALEHVPLIAVTNLTRALETLKDKNVFVVGLDSTGDADLAAVPLRGPLALVVGAEGKGLRQLTRTTCDAVARITLPGRIASLNVSNATALALYIASGRLS